MNNGALIHILKNLFWRIWILLIFVEEADTQIGQAYVISGQIIEVYSKMDDG